MIVAVILVLTFAAWSTQPPAARRFTEVETSARRVPTDAMPTAVAVGVVVGILAGSPLLATGPAAVGSVAHVARRRRRKHQAELARTADLRALVDRLVGRLRGGSTLTAALLDGAAASDGPWSVVGERIEAGQSMAAALVIEGHDDDERLLAATLEALARTGAPASHALERLSDTLRERADHREDVATQTRHASASAAVLAVMPFGFACIGAALSRDLAAFYLGTWLGAASLLSGAVLGATGWEWLHRMMRAVR